MDAPSARHRALAAIRTRVLATGTGGWFNDAEHLQLAIACAARAPHELIPVLFSGAVRNAVQPHVGAVAIVDDEWRALFGADARPLRDAGIALCASKPACAGVVERLQRALRCTVAETSEARAWQNLWSRLAVYVALHLDGSERRIGDTLGNFVGGDSRRLDELAVSIEEESVDALMLSDVIACLSRTVT